MRRTGGGRSRSISGGQGKPRGLSPPREGREGARQISGARGPADAKAQRWEHAVVFREEPEASVAGRRGWGRWYEEVREVMRGRSCWVL